MSEAKARKLTLKVLKKILDHPNEAKYQDLNYATIAKKLADTNYMEVLCAAGFRKETTDRGERLLFDNNAMDNLQEIYQALASDEDTDDDDQTGDVDAKHQEAPDSSVWSCAGCTFNNSIASDKCEICTLSQSASSVKASFKAKTGYDFDTVMWFCSKCSSMNTIFDSQCKDCSMPNPQVSDAQHLQYEDEENTEASMTLNIIQSHSDACFGKHQQPIRDISKCAHLYRIVNALKYYQLLDIHNNPDSQDAFSTFCRFSYTHFLNDYSHVITTHHAQLEEINDALMKHGLFGECDAFKCQLFTRYNDASRRGINGNDDTDVDDEKKYDDDIEPERETETDEISEIYADLLDAIHYWLFHLFDVGMRTRKDVKSMNVDNENEHQMDEEDARDQLARIQQNVLEKTKKYGLLREGEDETANKFTLKTTDTQTATSNECEPDHRLTFMDTLLQYFEASKLSPNVMSTVHEFLHNEEYDTDSVVDDLNGIETNTSNLLHSVENKEFAQIATDYVLSSKVPTFSTGFIWFYWKYYKNKEDVEQVPSSEINYGVEKMKELFVPNKYKDYKEEIIAHIMLIDFPVGNIRTFDKILAKTKALKKTNTARAMVASPITAMTSRHYGVSMGSPITMNHITSILLYCNYTKFCTAFSGTFRKLEWYESFESVKRRNSDFHWQSRFLREAVECFGKTGFGQLKMGRAKEEIKEDWHTEVGPFFTGLNEVLSIPEFRLRLCAPTSTSKSVEVATKFAKNKGMIMQINNKHAGGWCETVLPMLDCSWLSRYPDEDERLFCGGLAMIKIESVSLVNEGVYFQDSMEAMGLIDGMLSGEFYDPWYHPKISKQATQIVAALTDPSGTDGDALSSYHPYIHLVWKAYLQQKTNVVVVLAGLDQLADQSLHQWICEDGVARCSDDDICTRINLVSGDIFKVMPNIEKLTVSANSCAFNVLYFIENMATAPSWKQITIEEQGVGSNKYGFKQRDFWIPRVWKRQSMVLRAACKEKNLVIRVVQRDEFGQRYCSLMLNKIR